MCKAVPSINAPIRLPLNGIIKISSMVLIFCAFLNYNCLYNESIGSGISIYGGLFHITNVSQTIEIVIFLTGAFILNFYPRLVENSLNYIASITKSVKGNNTVIKNDSVTVKSSNEGSYAAEYTYNISREFSINYVLIILFSLVGASLLVSSYDLISMYLSIELQSFSVYVLATMNRNSEAATSAGLKYFLLGGLSSCFILLGCGIIYSLTGLTNFESLYMFISSSEFNSIIQGSFLGFIFIFIGFLFKVSAAPLHHWAPDVYDQTPTLVTIWLTIMPKLSILVLLLEIYTGFITSFSYLEDSLSNLNLILWIKNLLLYSSLFSLIIGSLLGLAQIKIKRLLAYSTVSHIGFILLALAVHTEISIDSFLFYIIQYTITNLNLFLIIIAMGYLLNYSIKVSKLNGTNTTQKIKDIKNISELKGQFFENPLLTLCFSVCLFSMAGIPPLIGFFAKQFVLYSSIQSGEYFLSYVAILVSVISASYYIKIVKVLYQERKDLSSSSYPSTATQEEENHNSTIAAQGKNTNFFKSLTISNSHSFLISSLTLIILLFILKPSLILNSSQLLSLSLFNF